MTTTKNTFACIAYEDEVEDSEAENWRRQGEDSPAKETKDGQRRETPIRKGSRRDAKAGVNQNGDQSRSSPARVEGNEPASRIVYTPEELLAFKTKNRGMPAALKRVNLEIVHSNWRRPETKTSLSQSPRKRVPVSPNHQKPSHAMASSLSLHDASRGISASPHHRRLRSGSFGAWSAGAESLPSLDGLVLEDLARGNEFSWNAPVGSIVAGSPGGSSIGNSSNGSQNPSWLVVGESELQGLRSGDYHDESTDVCVMEKQAQRATGAAPSANAHTRSIAAATVHHSRPPVAPSPNQECTGFLSSLTPLAQSSSSVPCQCRACEKMLHPDLQEERFAETPPSDMPRPQGGSRRPQHTHLATFPETVRTMQEPLAQASSDWFNNDSREYQRPRNYDEQACNAEQPQVESIPAPPESPSMAPVHSPTLSCISNTSGSTYEAYMPPPYEMTSSPYQQNFAIQDPMHMPVHPQMHMQMHMQAHAQPQQLHPPQSHYIPPWSMSVPPMHNVQPAFFPPHGGGPSGYFQAPMSPSPQLGPHHPPNMHASPPEHSYQGYYY